MPYAARGICAAPERRLVGSQQPQAVISGSVMTMTVRLLDGTRGVCVGYTALTEFTYEPHLKSRLHHRRIVVGVGSGSRHLRIVFRRLMPGSLMRPTWATRLPSQGLDEVAQSLGRPHRPDRLAWPFHPISALLACGDPPDIVRSVKKRPPGFMTGQLPCVWSRCVGFPTVS
jgi:hypothetical protein